MAEPNHTTENPEPRIDLSLQDVLDRLSGTVEVPAGAVANMRSSINTLCRMLDRAPRFVPADCAALRQVFEGASPGAIGLSRSNWANVKSNVRRAVRIVVDIPPASVSDVPLTEAWQALVALVSHVSKRSALRRFARFCCSRQIDPNQVDDQTVEHYRAFLDRPGQSKDPERVCRDLVGLWNRIVSSSSQRSLAPLKRRGIDRAYTMAWADLPEGLRDDARAYYAATTSRVRRRREVALSPVRTSTAEQHDRMLRRLAAAEIANGVTPDELHSLADLVRPDNLNRALEFFEDREEKRDTPGRQAFDMAVLANKIARDWAKLDFAEIKKIAGWCCALRPRRGGMTVRNCERLRQFANRQTVQTLMALPNDLEQRAKSLPSGFKAAILMQSAVMIDILLTAPLRLQNLRKLDRNRHIRKALSLSNETWHLEFSAEEMKNDRPLHLALPAQLVARIDLYMSRFQPLLGHAEDTSLLFPGADDRPKSDNAMRRQLSGTIRRELGLIMHPHLFRHLAALLYLRACPGDYETVRQLLGHRSLQTTAEFYAGFETDLATRRYHEAVFQRGEVVGDAWLGKTNGQIG